MLKAIDVFKTTTLCTQTGWKLFMRYVSLSYARVFPTWTPKAIFETFWITFCDIVTIICLRKCESCHSKLKGISKRPATFKETEYFVFLTELLAVLLSTIPGPRVNIKMTSYSYRKSHCGDKTEILWPSYRHNGISYTGKTTSLYWIGAQFYML